METWLNEERTERENPRSALRLTVQVERPTGRMSVGTLIVTKAALLCVLGGEALSPGGRQSVPLGASALAESRCENMGGQGKGSKSTRGQPRKKEKMSERKLENVSQIRRLLCCPGKKG